MFPILVKDARHGNCTFDENGKVVNGRIGTSLVVDIVKRPNLNKKYEGDAEHEYVPIVFNSSGRIVSLMPTTLRNIEHPYKLLSWSYGLYPHVDMDPLIDRCFEVGYTKVNIGPGSYASVFGITCEFSKKEPQLDGWPAVWKIVKEFGIGVGCGGTACAQLVNFVPTGSYGFGTHERSGP